MLDIIGSTMNIYGNKWTHCVCSVGSAARLSAKSHCMKYDTADIKDVSESVRGILNGNTQVVEVGGDDGVSHKVRRLNKGLFLYGITGSGKTHALYAIRKSLGNSACSGVENWVELLAEVKDRMGQGQSTKYVIDNITSNRYVFIDDVGAEKQTEWVQEILYLIVDRCYRHERVLFMSTNLSIAEFSSKYGDRLLSRIHEMCTAHEMDKVDRRIQ